ncbi:MAG: Mediator of RNA polymerase II transcription subunit 6 [Cirrosporium novae-zelandiae]|nr:MAG: Mediator of RNA polymerase II transcription subunit 6 [Cirrosporium novae-zelandiae]
MDGIKGPRDPPLDEIQWKSLPLAQSMGGLHTNTILPYFAQSPFFDATSNNATLTTQAMYNPNMYPIIQTREAFEGRLRSMQGLEFMVAFEPAQTQIQPGVPDSGIWVIRKQNRRKHDGEEDEIAVLATYFVLAESGNVYMAPTVNNILGSRMLSTVTSLTKFLSTVSSLPYFTPTLGYTYMSPGVKLQDSISNQPLSQASKENTPIPESQGAKSPKQSLVSKNASSADIQEAMLLAESLNLSIRYGNEYIDENPLVGEPGAFILSKVHEKPQGSTQSKTILKPPGADTPQLKISAPQDLPFSRKASKGSEKDEKSPITPGARDKLKRRKSRNPIMAVDD